MKMAKGKLGKLQMPKREEVDMSELDMEAGPSGEESPEYEMAESPEEEGGESPAIEGKEHGGGELSKVADEDLIAELKKRGLMGKLAEEGDMDLEASDEEMYS